MTQVSEYSLLEVAKAGLSSLLVQVGCVSMIFLGMLIMTGGEPDPFAIKSAILLGVLLVAFLEIKGRGFLPNHSAFDAKMKSGEVLRQYASGRRNFRSITLKGQDFTGIDLSGIDLSGADIRSTNFTNAVLRGVNFSEALGGQQNWWVIAQLMLVGLIAFLAGVLQGLTGFFIISFVSINSPSSLVLGCVYSLIVVSVFVLVGWQGLASRASSVTTNTIAAFVTTILSLSVALSVFSNGVIAVSFAVSFALAFAVVGAFAVAVAVVIAYFVTGAVTATLAVSFGFGIAVLVASQFTLEIAKEIADSSVFIVSFSVALTTFLLGCYLAWQALEENENFSTIRTFSLAVATAGGTSFCGADLRGTNFSSSFLQSTSFADSRRQSTDCTHTRWKGALRLNRVRFGNTILRDRQVRELLVKPEKGYKIELVGADLHGADLRYAVLEKANLKRCILNNASLKGSVLKYANLTEVQAIKTDLTNACLTGATLKSWNIDSTTVLKDVDCQYVYMREEPDIWGDRERRPHNPDKVFHSGDFEKLFKEMFDEVQILIRNGINPTAFLAAFQTVVEQNPTIVIQDAIKSVTKKGEDVLLTLQVPGGTDKGTLERAWDSGYQACLKTGHDTDRIESKAKLEESKAKLEKLLLTFAEKGINTYK